MWSLIWSAITWASAGYVVNDVTRTVGQWTDTGEYYEPKAPTDSNVVLDVKRIPAWQRWVLYIGLGGALAWFVYNQMQKKKK